MEIQKHAIPYFQSVVISTLSEGSRLSAHPPPPSFPIRGNALEMASSQRLVATCAREKMPEAKLKPRGRVSPAGTEETVSPWLVASWLWSLDTVVCNRCVQLRRLALPRTANRYSAPETGSTLRRRETGLTSGSRDNPSWGVS